MYIKVTLTHTLTYTHIHTYSTHTTHHSHCRDLLDTLQRWCTEPLEFAYVFLRWDFLTMYTVYCTNYSKGNECLERSLSEDEALREFIDVRREGRVCVCMREGEGGGREGERKRERRNIYLT